MNEARIAGQLTVDSHEVRVVRDQQKYFGVIDVSSIHVHSPSFMEPLRYDDAELTRLTEAWSQDPIKEVPGFRYWEMEERKRCMCYPENRTGDQQRAFDFYWQIRFGTQMGHIGLGIGTTTQIGPACLGTDKNCGVSPHIRRYGPEYGYPHMMVDADKPFPFYDDQFNFVMCNHVIEHMADPTFTINEMLRVTRPGGIVGIITPDMAYNERGMIDPTHTHEFSSDAFIQMLTDDSTVVWEPFEIIAHNTLDNRFSFDSVLRKVKRDGG